MMRSFLGIEPVSVNQIAVRVEGAKEAIWENRFPDIALNPDPIPCNFCSRNFHSFTGRGLINDPSCIGLTAARRADALSVDTCMNGDRIARLGSFRRRDRKSTSLNSSHRCSSYAV